MIRVGLDYRPALFTRAGIGRATRELASAIAPRARKAGIELHLFGHGWKKALVPEGPPEAALHRSRIPGRSLSWIAPLGFDASRLSGGSSIFHWTDYVHPPVRRRGTSCILTLHDLAFLEDPTYHGPRASALLRKRCARALSRARAVICPSRATAEALLHHRRRGALPDGPDPVVIPFGADHGPRGDPRRGRARAARLLRAEHEPGFAYLCVLGTLEPRKNHDSLLRALELLADRGLRIPLLVLGGTGWETSVLETRLRKAGRRPPGGEPLRLAWISDLDDDEVFDLLAGARVCAYPSSLEGFGFPPLEALERGVPVLAGDCPALREVLGPAARFAPGRNPEALAEGLEVLWTNESERSSRLEEWRKRAPRFRWDDCARAHLALYRECGT